MSVWPGSTSLLDCADHCLQSTQDSTPTVPLVTLVGGARGSPDGPVGGSEASTVDSRLHPDPAVERPLASGGVTANSCLIAVASDQRRSVA